MAEKHIADKEAAFVAVNGPPDMCRVGNSIIPFDITDTLDKARDPSANVHARGNPVLTQTTRVNSVAGDAGSGIVSGTSRGHTIVLQGSSTVFVNGKPCARHDDPVGMNCNGGDTFNTTGQLKTLKLGPKPQWGSKEAGKDLRERLKETSRELHDNPMGKTPEQAAAVQDKVKQLVTDTAEHEKAAMQAAMKGGGDTATWTEAATMKSGARNMVAEAERQVKWANSTSKELVDVAVSQMPLSGIPDAVQDGGKAWDSAKSGNYLGATGHMAMAVLGIATELPVLKQLKGAVKLGKAATKAKGATKAAGAAKDVAKGAGAAKDARKGADAAKDAGKAGDAGKGAGKPAAGGGGNGTVIKKKAKRKPKRRCELVPYNELQCEPGQEAHHVIPDWMLRLGKRGGLERIAGLPDLASGPAICLEGGSGKEHNTAHKHTDRPAQRIAKNGAASGIAGTLKLGHAKAISARAIEKATGGKKGGGCDRADIKKQLTESFKAPDETLLRGVKNARSVTQAIKDVLSGGKD